MERNGERAVRETNGQGDGRTMTLIGRADGQPFLNSYAAKLRARELGQGYSVIRLPRGRDGVPRFVVGWRDEIAELGLAGNGQRLGDGGEVGRGFGDRGGTSGWDGLADGLKKAKDVISDAWTGKNMPPEPKQPPLPSSEAPVEDFLKGVGRVKDYIKGVGHGLLSSGGGDPPAGAGYAATSPPTGSPVGTPRVASFHYSADAPPETGEEQAGFQVKFHSPNDIAFASVLGDSKACTVLAHGDSEHIWDDRNGKRDRKPLGPDELYMELIKAGCKPGQPIKLLSCNAAKGPNSLAERLHKACNCEVTGADSYVSPYPKVEPVVRWSLFPNIPTGISGNWRTFK